MSATGPAPGHVDHGDSIALVVAKHSDRRDRIVDVARSLAAAGGYDAVQMRDVSARSGVALGTLYRSFPSKDHLLVSVMSKWTDQLSTQLHERPPRGSSPTTQVTDVLLRACRSLEREPNLATAVIRAMGSAESGVSAASREVGHNLRRMIDPLLADLDGDVRDGVVEIINHVWLSTLLGWSSGRLMFSQVTEQLARTVRMLLDDDIRLPGRSGPRPTRP